MPPKDVNGTLGDLVIRGFLVARIADLDLLGDGPHPLHPLDRTFDRLLFRVAGYMAA